MMTSPTPAFDMQTCMEAIHENGYVEFGSRIVAESFANRLRRQFCGASGRGSVPVRVVEVGEDGEDGASMWRVVAESHPLT